MFVDPSTHNPTLELKTSNTGSIMYPVKGLKHLAEAKVGSREKAREMHSRLLAGFFEAGGCGCNQHCRGTLKYVRLRFVL